MTDFAELHTAYRKNVFPAMVADLAEQLGVSAASLLRIEVGWCPAEACWTFPERDSKGKIIGISRRFKGKIIGISRRFKNGKKLSVKGSERGLTYPLSDQANTGEIYQPGKGNWVHVSSEFRCPICGKEDWCLVSSENPADPQAVICGRKAEGAKQPLGDAGYLHIRKESGNVSLAGQVLPLSDLPVLLVEGQSDTACALDLGFIAVGKPSASGGLAYLADLLIGRDRVVVLGENDAGAGRLGMEKTFEALRRVCKNVTKVMPPPGIKDLRAWKQSGLTHELLVAAIAAGDETSASTTLESKAPLYIADLWLKKEHMMEGKLILRKYRGIWYRYNGRHYAEIEEDTTIRGSLYRFLSDKKVKKFGSKGDVTLEPYEANRTKISDITDALSMDCPVTDEPPCWLDGRGGTCGSLITFANGTLDTDTMELVPNSPALFTLSSLPYDYDPSATCPLWETFLGQIFPDDPAKALLLQEWFGYNMAADTSQEKLMLLVGRPRAGKSTVMDVMRCVLGKGQVASTSFQDLCGPFGLQPLVGKLAAFLPDASVPRHIDATQALETIKKITGRDCIDIQRKFLPALSDYRPYCRFTISANELPELPDHAKSLEARLNLIYFGQSFEGHEDRTLKDRLPLEAQGIAVWALQGLRRLRSQGRFTVPTSSTPVIGEFRRAISPMTEFAEDWCAFGEGEQYFVAKNMIFDAWSAWAKDHGMTPGTRSRFGQRFMALFPACGSERRTVRGQQIGVYAGIRLTEACVNKYVMGTTR
jgi:putative DNA primase/helicase